MKKTAVLVDDLFLEHIPDFQHVESPDRLKIIYEQLRRPGQEGRFVRPDFMPASLEDLGRVHTAGHVARVASTAGKVFDSLDPDTQTSRRSYEAACLAAGAVIKGVEILAAGEVDNAFALVRPPGHHAEADRAMGFCLFNNAAVGAAHALEVMGMERVLLVDWDLHHGNGTQNSFYDTDQVLYFSTHAFPYYPGTGGVREVGRGRGEGYTVNVPLSGGQGDRAYGRIFNELLVPVARQYRPDIIIVSAGFDIYVEDPLGTMAVTAMGFAYMTKILAGLAAELCNGRLLFTLEGGYHLGGLRDGVLAVLDELSGVGAMPEEKFQPCRDSDVQVGGLELARSVAKLHWNL